MKAVNHLKDDIEGYKKQKKHLDKEIKEDKDLIKSVRKKAKPTSMARYRTYSSGDLKKHIKKEKELLKRKENKDGKR